TAINIVIYKILSTNYGKLDRYEQLSESEQREIHENYKYIPHHNTRVGLVDSLRGTIDDIQKKIEEKKLNRTKYFHKDGSLKITNVARYAVEQEGFADKYGDVPRSLNKHIKELDKEMNST